MQQAIALTTPLDEATVRRLAVGQMVELSGRVYTGRDAVHHRLFHGQPPPVDLRGQVIYHCGPVMVREGDRWRCRAAGPTTSSREEPYQWKVIEQHGLRGIIGKGGMGERTREACRRHGCVYLHAIGGAAQVYARCVARVDGVDWPELGSPEAIWHLWVERLPALVTIDAEGRSLHAEVLEASEAAFAALRA